jgi:hypothetical protein
MLYCGGMNFNLSEQRELRRGNCITRRMRLKSTGEEMWVEIKRSWDVLYFRVDDSPWERTVSAAAAHRPTTS